MKNPASQPKFWLLVGAALILAVVLLAVVLFRHSGQVVPLSQCSPVYRHYAQVSGIEASFVKDFPLNDTLAIDVTLLHATTDPAWQQLKHDFGLDSSDPETVDFMNRNKIVSHFSPKTDYSLRMDTVCKTNNDFISFSFTDKIVSVFHIEDTLQIQAVILWQFKAMVNKKPLIDIKNEKQIN